MSLIEQIKAEVDKDKDDLSQLKFGEYIVTVQDGKAIRTEISKKRKVDATDYGY